MNSKNVAEMKGGVERESERGAHVQIFRLDNIQ